MPCGKNNITVHIIRAKNNKGLKKKISPSPEHLRAMSYLSA